jgi:hypothetical protein
LIVLKLGFYALRGRLGKQKSRERGRDTCWVVRKGKREKGKGKRGYDEYTEWLYWDIEKGGSRGTCVCLSVDHDG